MSTLTTGFFLNRHERKTTTCKTPLARDGRGSTTRQGIHSIPCHTTVRLSAEESVSCQGGEHRHMNRETSKSAYHSSITIKLVLLICRSNSTPSKQIEADRSSLPQAHSSDTNTVIAAGSTDPEVLMIETMFITIFDNIAISKAHTFLNELDPWNDSQ